MAQSHEHEHDHECECGCESGVYPPYLAIGTIGFIMLAIPLIVSGIMNILAFSHNGDIYWDPTIRTVCIYVYAISGICLLIIAAYGFLTGIYAESILFVMYAMLALVMFFVVKDGGLTNNAAHLVDFLFGALFLIPFIAFILNREALLAIAAFALAFGLILSEIISYFDASSSVLVFGIFFVMAGILFTYIAIANLLYAEGGYEIPLV